MLKRLIDILLAAFGVMLVLPFFPLLALLIKLDSKGPVFYLCDRVGKDGEPFKMYKFRTMYETPSLVGPSVSPEGDPRVTPMGRMLRRTKVNELPQFINVLKGDMSFVGPRPEALDLAALYPPYAKAIFSVKPGLVGPNQILGRNEEEWYPLGVGPQQYYINEILPKKLPIDLEYVQQCSTFTDLKYIFLGVKETLFKVLTWNLMLQNKSQIYLIFADLLLSLLSLILSHALSFPDFFHYSKPYLVLQLLPIMIFVRVFCFFYFGLYGTLIRFLSLHDIAGVFKAVSAGSMLLIICFAFLSNFRHFSRLAFFIDWFCLIVLMSGLRLGLRYYWDNHLYSHELDNLTHRNKVLIYGAGSAGALAYQALIAEKNGCFDVVGFLDDDPGKCHKTLYGKKVLGNRHTLETVVRLYQVQHILLAMPSMPPPELTKLKTACQHAQIPYRIFPTLKDAPLLIHSSEELLSG